MYHEKMNKLYELFKDFFIKGKQTAFNKASYIQDNDPFLVYLGECDMCDVLYCLANVMEDLNVEYELTVKNSC